MRLTFGIWRSCLSRKGAAAAAFAIGFCTLTAGLQAQSISVGSGSGPVGTTIGVDLGFTAGSTPIASLSVDLSFSAELTYVSAGTGGAASGAGKSAIGSPISGGVRILIYGVNQNAIGSGTLATLNFSSSRSATPQTVALQVSDVTASDPNAKAVQCSGSGGSITLTAPVDNTPPTISNVSASGVTSSTAVIKWTTDKPADSFVEYGTTVVYGSSGPSDATLNTAHSITLQNLNAFTLYHFRVKSRDATGNAALTGDYTFTTAMAVSLYFPRLLSTSAAQPTADNRMYTGVALANVDKNPATLRFTAYDTAGSTLSGSNVVNPASRVLNAGNQMPFIDSDLFGSGLSDQNLPGWIKIESSTSSLAGLFLTFNSSLTALDGALASSALKSSLVLTEVEDQGFNMINISNPNPDPAALKLDLMKSDGTVKTSATQNIKAGAALVADLAADLFRGVTIAASDYIRVTSDRGVSSFELFGKPASDIAGLNGQDAGSGAKTLYCPQYVVGSGWLTRLSVVNLDNNAGTVTLRFIGDDGRLLSEKQSPIAALGKIRIDDPAFFVSVSSSAPSAQGYLEIVSDGVRMAGSVVFGGSGDSTFSAALPLVATLQNSVLFSQVSSNAIYFTGIAILNPNNSDATATLDVYSSGGQLEFRSLVSIPAKHRQARLLTEYFPALSAFDRSSGYIRLTSDKPVAGFALFGTSSLQVLSAIPAQTVP